MRVWIVNPFDPLPGDPEQEGRYATLARVLIARGHRVLWWTSTFSHRFKRPVDQAAIRTACAAGGIDVEFLAAPPYQRNIGLRRVRSHGWLAKQFELTALPRAPRPNVIVVSSPPPVLAWRAVHVARQLGARSIVDVQDAWPDVFTILAPRVLRPLVSALVPAMRGNVRRAARTCDAIVGVADAYVELFQRDARGPKLTATIPLGVDLAAFDAAALRGRNPEYVKRPGELWLAYTGSLNHNYDFLTILRAAARLGAEHQPPLRFFLDRPRRVGRAGRAIGARLAPDKCDADGVLDFEPWANLLAQCDIGFNASFPETMIYLPNKVFYYLAAGTAVLNTIPGQCSQIVQAGGCGQDYRAGDPESCAAAIRELAQNADTREAMKHAARRLAETDYDRARLLPRYAELIERLGAARLYS